jgi:hypothetical protein
VRPQGTPGTTAPSASTGSPGSQPGTALRSFTGQRPPGTQLSRHPGLPTAATAAAATGAAGAAGAAATTASPRARTFDPSTRTSRFGANRTLRNQVFTNPNIIGPGSQLAATNFRGRFAGARAARFAAGGNQNWFGRHHHHRFWGGRVLGWYGPVFWPYAYYDFFDYSFWPYAYDSFWPYAYDDLYGGIFGPYAYGPGYDPGAAPPPGVADAGPDDEPTGSVQVCADQVQTLTNLPIDRIAKTVEPTPAQMSQLDALADATRRALGILRGACPTRLPTTPTARLAAMQGRLEAMLRAVDTIAPAMHAFYDALTDEQRAKLDATTGPEPAAQDQNQPAGADQPPPEVTQACNNTDAGVALPIDRIEQDVRPDERQRAALDNLANASARAAEKLKASCTADTSLTMVGRVDAMRQRLTTMLDAIIMVRPALEAFYNSLNYEQRARFNVIGSTEG